MNRYFQINAYEKMGGNIYSESLAKRIEDAIESRYDGWEGNLAGGNSMKMWDANWYDCEEDMIAISKEFPDVRFEVYCEGSCFDDIWNAGFCCGRTDCRCAEIPELNYDYLIYGNDNLVNG